LDSCLRSLTGSNTLRISIPRRQVFSEAFWQFTCCETVKQRLIFRRGSSPRVELLLPGGLLLFTAVSELTGVRDNFFVNVEVNCWIETEDFLGCCHFIIAQGSAEIGRASCRERV